MSCQVMEKARVVGMGLCKALWDCDLKKKKKNTTQNKQMSREENRVEMQRGKGPPRQTTWMP